MTKIDEGIIPYNADWLSGKPQILRGMPDNAHIPNNITNTSNNLEGLIEEIDMVYNDALKLDSNIEGKKVYLYYKMMFYKNRYKKWLDGYRQQIAQYCQTKNDELSGVIYDVFVSDNDSIQINS